MRTRRGWSKVARDYAFNRKMRLACRYIGCVEDSRDPQNWCPRPPARSGARNPVPQNGDSVVVDVDPDTTYPLTIIPDVIDTVWVFSGNVGTRPSEDTKQHFTTFDP